MEYHVTANAFFESIGRLEMEEEMLEAARELQFEKAALIRDQIETIQSGKHGGGQGGAAECEFFSRPHERTFLAVAHGWGAETFSLCVGGDDTYDMSMSCAAHPRPTSKLAPPNPSNIT